MPSITLRRTAILVVLGILVIPLRQLYSIPEKG
jgi:hypothetical protein